MITADVHLHTLHSHGKATTHAMFEAAAEKGLTVIGFSEHSPRPAGFAYPSDYQQGLTATFSSYVEEVTALKSNRQLLEVLLGVEVDYITGEEGYAAALTYAYPYDYCIGGLHFQGAWGFDWSEDHWLALGREERYAVYARYYEDLKEMCETRLFQVVAHPDLIKIFTVETFREWLETAEAAPAVLRTLAAIRDNGMAMEVSSAGLRKPCAEIYPGPRIMAMARDLGVPISFGSDAHCTGTPAHAFEELARYAASYGYRESLVFRQKKPEAVPFT